MLVRERRGRFLGVCADGGGDRGEVCLVSGVLIFTGGNVMVMMKNHHHHQQNNSNRKGILK